MPGTNNIAFTAPINPAGATPVLTRAQVWAGLQRKIKCAEEFVGGILASTDVIDEYTDEQTGNAVVVREIMFVQGSRRVREKVTSYEPSRVDFLQPTGGMVSNLVSEDAQGQLLMTYSFEMRHPDMDAEELAKARAGETAMSRKAVEGSIAAMRDMVKDGRIKA